jgi:hypothetical protein
MSAGAELLSHGTVDPWLNGRWTAANRPWAALVLGACLGLLSVAAWLTPDPRGLGTHEQLGHPPCLTMMAWGVPCPTCGMCTAFAHAVRGEVLRAFHAQPAGLALAMVTVVSGLASGLALVTGRTARVPWVRTTRIAAIAVSILLAGWGYKVLMTWFGL